MLQFSCFFAIFRWSSLKLKLFRVDKGLYQDISTFYDYFKSYVLVIQTETSKFILIFTIFSSFLKMLVFF